MRATQRPGDGACRHGRSTTIDFFSLHQTRAQYCRAWKKFMMKKAWPKELKPQVKIEQKPVAAISTTFCPETL